MVENKNGFAQTTTMERIHHRLNEEKTAAAMDRLLDRIDTLEKAVTQLSTVLEQGPGLMAMTVDMVDESYRQAKARGVHFEERLGAALQIAEKLTAPAMVEKLDQVLQLVDQTPGLVAMAVDMADEGYRQAKARGVHLEERLGAALQIAEKLTAPAMVEKLEQLLQLADQAPGLVAMTVDMLDEEMRRLPLADIDLPSLLELAAQFSAAAKAAKTMPDTKVGGIFSMLRTMRDPDRQMALGYLMNIAKAWGQALKK